VLCLTAAVAFSQLAIAQIAPLGEPGAIGASVPAEPPAGPGTGAASDPADPAADPGTAAGSDLADPAAEPGTRSSGAYMEHYPDDTEEDYPPYHWPYED
ncbi:MAG: hypothetical protein LBQ79_10260, partial [Deltaproteobacteria bacterium]|nr:hypothetical protein [Deltaproteobacteria bacterium]